MCSQKPCRTASLKPQASPAQPQAAAVGPGSGHLWRERQSGCHCHQCIWPDLKPATVSPLPVAVATKKRMIELHPMVRSVCSVTVARMVIICFLCGIDNPIFTTVDSQDLHIHEQDTY